MSKEQIKQIRNVAIIAHVDHGKTTLVDAMLHQSGIFRENEQIAEQVMDSNALERERGITILAKNTAIVYKGVRINVVDTPGHADFGGEVERVLKMVDGVLLVVDAFDGPMPQTRFVLRKALAMRLLPIVVINKTDRADARPVEVVDQVLDLFIELGADEDQLDFPVVYASARMGIASRAKPPTADDTILPLLDAVIEYTPCPMGDRQAPLQMLVSNIDYDNYIGRVAIGRIERGAIHHGEAVAVCGEAGPGTRAARVVRLLRFEGLSRHEIDAAGVGEIVCVAGIPDIAIGETICDPDTIEPLAFVDIDEPTIAMTFSVNDSPFAGKEGKYVTSRHLRDRLFREIETNVSMRLETTDTTESFIVKGRGELHLSILVETMRREGYEFQLSKPKVIQKEIDGALCEPVEALQVDVPDEYVGVVIEKLGARKAALNNMHPPQNGNVRLEFTIPSRGLIGYRSEFLTDTRGNGIMSSTIFGYEPWKGDIDTRNHGVLVAWETGEAMTYGLHNAQERGVLFIGAGQPVYEGMVVGASPKNEDIMVNVCRRKHVTNIRAAGSDDALRLVPPVSMSLEQYMEFVADDELIEVTPQSIRLRKRILNSNIRTRARSRKDA